MKVTAIQYKVFFQVRKTVNSFGGKKKHHADCHDLRNCSENLTIQN